MLLGDDPVCCPAGTNVILGTSNGDNLNGGAGRDLSAPHPTSKPLVSSATSKNGLVRTCIRTSLASLAALGCSLPLRHVQICHVADSEAAGDRKLASPGCSLRPE